MFPTARLRVTSIMEAFKTVARHPKVKEIVIKPKLDKGPQVDKYRSFIMTLMAEDRSGKIRLADRKMAMAEAIPSFYCGA